MTPSPTARPSLRQRRQWLWGALAASLAATGWAALQGGDEADAVATPVTRGAASSALNPSAAAPRPTAAPPAPWPAPPQRQLDWAGGPDWPAERAGWAPPAPPPPPPPPKPVAVAAAPAVAPAPPPAPPFPYQMIGRLEEAGLTRVMLSNAQRTLVVQAGDAVDTQWRVDEVQARAVTLTWLPTGQHVTLSFPSS